METTGHTIYMTVHLDADTDLPTINQNVEYYEGEIGPLFSMKADANSSLLTFDAVSDAPAKTATVSEEVNGNPNVPAGSTLVTTGQIFVGNRLTACAASRPQ